VINGDNGLLSASGSGRGVKWDRNGSTLAKNCEKAVTIEYIKTVRESNLGRLQGKQAILRFILKKQNIINDVRFYSSFSTSNSFLPKCNSRILYELQVYLGGAGALVGGSIAVTNRYVKHRQIELMLIQQGVHPNPGPEPSGLGRIQYDLAMMTYNCRGLSDINKVRRLFAKLNLLVNKNYIIALQETHLIKDNVFNLYWKHSHLKNCTTTNKGGVVLLFNKSYKVNYEYNDAHDRVIIAELENDKYKIIVGNVYYPTNHLEALAFNEGVYEKLLEYQFRSAESYVCLMGDMNQCLKPEDFLNRTKTKVEYELADLTILNNDLCGLIDGFRVVEKDKGYTWNRGSCYSRLDYIFLSDELKSKIVVAYTDWCVEKSDHAAVVCKLKVENNIVKGRGIIRINADLLDSPEIANEVREHVKMLKDQIPVDWDPHSKLEYTKVAIRSGISLATGRYNKDKKAAQDVVEEQLDRLIRQKITELGRQPVNTVLVNKIDEAKTELLLELDNLRTKYSKDLAFKSGVRWYEQGEKSNKYFLGLIKVRERKKMISEIRNNGEIGREQESITNIIKNFYEKLYSKVKQVDRTRDEEYFKLCPKLDKEGREDLDRDITNSELLNTLRGCKETASGPDGLTYKTYKCLWPIIGDEIVQSWNHSVRTGLMPPSHLESVLTLLPKEGKDTKEIKNWRPITLTNCDAKIITKALANRMSKHLDKIIHPAQTAYIPTRSVMDNLRSNIYYRDYCKKAGIDGVIISLDAKKAFDSVSHDYILNTLKAYGVGVKFQNYFKVLYNEIKVKILVNGYFSEGIRIERGVKQGDALSCSLFILSIDPLIRNLNNNPLIKAITLKGKKTGCTLTNKASGYADDIAVICYNDLTSIQEIFREYERLTRMSGLELNAEKTEILRIGPEVEEIFEFDIKYMKEEHRIRTIRELKICGIFICNDKSKEYEHNILSKIVKLEGQLKAWMCRNLTLEGKILIVKTYGLSQLIYNLQCYQILDKEIKLVERLIFKFIWCREWSSNKWVERIGRKVLKNEYEEGGMKAPDIECMNKALKLKQFLRANKVTHPICTIQKISCENNNYNEVINQEYDKLDNDHIIGCSQSTINLLTDNMRNEIMKHVEIGETNTIVINMVGSINISIYLRRKNELLVDCLFNTAKAEGIETLGELQQELEHTKDKPKLELLKKIQKYFPNHLLNSSSNFISEINEKTTLTHIYLGNESFLPLDEVKVCHLHLILKKIMGKIETLDFCTKLGINTFEKSSLVGIRKQIQNVKFRNIYYRLINKDFFTRQKLHKYKITDSDKCLACNQVEDFKHLVWECRQVKETWNNLNEILSARGLQNENISTYEDVLNFGGSAAANTIKLCILQRFIQIDRQTKLSKESIDEMARGTITKEKYIALKNNKLPTFIKKWNGFVT